MDEERKEIPASVLKDILEKASKRGYKPSMKLPERVFALGVEVGYNAHMDGVGWVMVEREELLKKGAKFGLRKLLEYYYNKGKEFGHERRMNDLLSGKKGEDSQREGERTFGGGGFSDSEEFELPDPVNMTEIPRLEEIFQPLTVLPGVTLPKLFRTPGLFN
ncbi:hypothetical protein B6U90_02030 [Thermoplasmatales archaeon ex4484_6]|nr:MAG: hypothetical protein B6U90_02030 [Thermoplasmatales archaeon ex4484_6]RLF66657.1 MAG: hypothetical protein DRN57_06660 [Thermoplasmata archaeon]